MVRAVLYYIMIKFSAWSYGLSANHAGHNSKQTNTKLRFLSHQTQLASRIPSTHQGKKEEKKTSFFTIDNG